MRRRRRGRSPSEVATGAAGPGGVQPTSGASAAGGAPGTAGSAAANGVPEAPAAPASGAALMIGLAGSTVGIRDGSWTAAASDGPPLASDGVQATVGWSSVGGVDAVAAGSLGGGSAGSGGCVMGIP